jgi:radical SAM protein with 4Fe4S-binding SPASM domain
MENVVSRANFKTLVFMSTYKCNVTCKHCGIYCSPKDSESISLEDMKRMVDEASELGFLNIVFSGGEPTMLGDDLNKIIEYISIKNQFVAIRMVTNATWAKTKDIARKKLSDWKKLGLNEINISCGEFHQKEVPLKSVINAFECAKELKYDTVLLAGEFLYLDKGSIKPNNFFKEIGFKLTDINESSLFSKKKVIFNLGAVIPVGRGKDINPDNCKTVTYEELENKCNHIFDSFVAHPNGDVYPCCGVMVRNFDNLKIGNWKKGSINEIMGNSEQDLILNWIKYLGVKDMADWIVCKSNEIKFKKRYVSICELCYEILSSEKCYSILTKYGHEKRDEIIAQKIIQDAAKNPEFVY